jgi:hypothetical protein
MRAGSKETIYTETMSTRVTPEVLAAVKEASVAAWIKPCAWLRKVIANGLRGDESQRVVLAELMALRTVLLTLKKERWREAGELTDELLDAISDAADARKFAQADARILAGKSK